MTKDKYTLLSLNLNFYNHNSSIKRQTHDIATFILETKPTLIALQEFGTNSYTGDVSGTELLELLKNKGFATVPHKDSINPVNTRLLFDTSVVRYVRKLPPFHEKDFINRQSGGVFEVVGKLLAIYSLHLPLYKTTYQDNSVEKKAMWHSLIQFAKNTSADFDYVIVAGDFNENMLNNQPTVLASNLDRLADFLTPASLNIPTWNNRKLDHIFVTKELKFKSFEPLENEISDHKALFIEFSP